MSLSYQHEVHMRQNRRLGLNLTSFKKTPANIIRNMYKELRQFHGLSRDNARHVVMQLVMASDWPR